MLAGARAPDGSGWLADLSDGAGDASSFGGAEGAPQQGGNTTIGVLATNAPLTKAEAGKLAQMAQDGLACALRPAHTPFDGDTLFALSLATVEERTRAPAGVGAVILAQLGALAAQVTAAAIADAVRAATALHGVPALRDLARDSA